MNNTKCLILLKMLNIPEFKICTLPKGTVLYHERETFFPNSNMKSTAPYTWYSFQPGFFTMSDDPTYPTVWYSYITTEDINCLVEVSSIYDVNSILKEFILSNGIPHPPRILVILDDYT